MKRLLLVLSGALVLAAILLYLGGAIQWDRESPYELQKNWGSLGDGADQFNEPTGIAVTRDAVYVADSRNGRIQVFDRQGRHLRSISEGLQRPMNLEVNDEELLVADFFADAILIYSLDGQLRQTVRAEDGLKNPGGVAGLADGSLLVADTYRHRIVQLSRAGEVLRVWGTPDQPGSGKGEFNYPTDVAAATDGGFYVTDGYNDRVQRFDSDGDYVRRWGGPFGMNIYGPFKGWFATATSIAVSADDRSVFVTDFYHDRVQKFCDRGVYFTSFGTPSPNATHTAMALDVDANGDVWVANYALNRVERWHQVTQ